MMKELELIKLHKDRNKIEFGVYDKDKSLKGILVFEAPYKEFEDCENINVK